MKTYESLSLNQQAAIELALIILAHECLRDGLRLRNDDPAAVAAEALAVYVDQSKNRSPRPFPTFRCAP